MNEFLYLSVIISILVGSTFLYSYDSDPARQSQRRSLSGFRVLYYLTLVSASLFSTIPLFYSNPLLLDVTDSSILSLIGVVVASFGFIIFAISKKELGFNYSPCYKALRPNELVTTGIYKYIRHPLYTANLTIIFGFFLISGSLYLLINLAILLASYIKSTELEEESLNEQFDYYRDYQRSTGKFLPKRNVFIRSI